LRESRFKKNWKKTMLVKVGSIKPPRTLDFEEPFDIEKICTEQEVGG